MYPITVKCQDFKSSQCNTYVVSLGGEEAEISKGELNELLLTHLLQAAVRALMSKVSLCIGIICMKVCPGESTIQVAGQA